MAKSRKSNKSGSAKPSVKVRDMKAKKDPKGGFIWFESSAIKGEIKPALDPAALNFNKVIK